MHNVNIGGMFCSIVGYLLLVARKEIPSFCLYSYSVFIGLFQIYILFNQTPLLDLDLHLYGCFSLVVRICRFFIGWLAVAQLLDAVYCQFIPEVAHHSILILLHIFSVWVVLNPCGVVADALSVGLNIWIVSIIFESVVDSFCLTVRIGCNGLVQACTCQTSEDIAVL